MGSTTIFNLPAELLDRIYAYLHWDRTTHLIPSRPDISSISLACKPLRQSVIPLLFRNVDLCLRWADGELLEPGLYRLRREKPDLARHIRCVHICTRLGYKPGSYREDVASFAVPDDVVDWLTPELTERSADDRYHVKLGTVHRKRVRDVVQKHYKSVSETNLLAEEAVGTTEALMQQLVAQSSYASHEQREQVENESAKAAHRNLEQLGANGYNRADDSLPESPHPTAPWKARPADQRIKCRTDALATVMLCLPATVTEIMLESDGINDVGNAVLDLFSLYVLASALEVFNTRLEKLTVSANTRPSPSRRRGFTLTGPVTDEVRKSSSIITDDIVSGLTNVKKLTLSSPTSSFGVVEPGGPHCDAREPSRWHALPAQTLTALEFSDVRMSEEDLDKLLKSAQHFAPLKKLVIRNLCLWMTSMRRRLMQQQMQAQGQPATAPMVAELGWLRFLISLRRALPTTRFELADLHAERGVHRGSLPASALNWLLTEAVPPATERDIANDMPVIDHQREVRLFEDFESFLPLWEAEDSVRGVQAAEQRKDGALVDAAMCSRWKLFANVRRDQGEWTTL